MSEKSVSRRDFIKLTTAVALTASGLLGLEGLFRFLNTQTEPLQPTDFDLGSTSKYPTGSHTVIPEVPALLIHTENGFAALSLVCTHLGCTSTVTPQELVCPCHGSIFDRRGNVIKGPADRPLSRYAVEDRGEKIAVLL